MLQMTGGTYTDEATGSTMPMLSGDVLVACVPAVTSGSTTTGIQMTPLTSMAHARAKAMTGGMTDANIATAHAAVGTYFSVSDILHTVPMDPMVAGSGGTATQDQKNYGMSIAAMSQYAKTHRDDDVLLGHGHGDDERCLGRRHGRDDGRRPPSRWREWAA